MAADQRDVGAEEDGRKAEDEDEAGADAAGVAAGQEGADCSDEVPEMLELIDAAEAEAGNPAGLAAVLRNIGRRLRASPDDRDLLSDFEGIAQICAALAEPPHSWRGEAMLAFCRAMPDVCRLSPLNRGALRDAGFVVATVDLLHWALEAGDEAAAFAASLSLRSLCTASDANKRIAVQPRALPEEANDPAAQTSDRSSRPGALPLLLDAIERFPASIAMQTESLWAFRTLLTDDDSRQAQAEEMSSAAENREAALDSGVFPQIRAIVERTLGFIEASEQPLPRLREQVLLLLKELARGEERIHELAFGSKLLSRLVAPLDTEEDPRVLRAILAALRAFAFSEEARDELAMLSDGARRCMAAVRRHAATPAVCEQGFGLFANLTLRKSPIASRLNDGDQGIIALGQFVLRQQPERPDVARAVIQAIRNVTMQDDAAAAELRDCQLFDEFRKLVQERQGNARWHLAVEAARQLLREFRADEGVQRAPKYNEYY